LSSLVYTGKQLIAVGAYGIILNSRDGVTWETRFSGTTVNLSNVIWTGDSFFAVGDSGTILTSSDGTNWSNIISPTIKNLRAITKTSELIVAVGDSGTILTSQNGLTWTKRNLETDCQLNSITWTGSQFVTVGASIIIVHSKWYDYSDFGSGQVYTSPDGIVWTQKKPGTNKPLNFVLWTGNQLIATGSSILTSLDGEIWKNVENTGPLFSVTLTDKELIAVGSSNTILTSQDGNVWEKTLSGTYNWLHSITCTESLLVAVGKHGTILTSPQEITGNKQQLSRASFDFHRPCITAVPNSEGQILVNMSGFSLSKDIIFYMYNASGKCIQITKSPALPSIRIPYGNLASGRYFLEALTNNSKASNSFVICK
jgi:hypothetical protein